MNKTHTVMECMHRFCSDCLDSALRITKVKCCPQCRVHLVSRTIERKDSNSDSIINILYPNRDEIDNDDTLEMKEILNSKSHQLFVKSIQQAASQQHGARKEKIKNISLEPTRFPKETLIYLNYYDKNFFSILLSMKDIPSIIVAPLSFSMASLTKLIMKKIVRSCGASYEAIVSKGNVLIPIFLRMLKLDPIVFGIKRIGDSDELPLSSLFEFYFDDNKKLNPEATLSLCIEKPMNINGKIIKVCDVRFKLNSNLFIKK